MPSAQEYVHAAEHDLRAVEALTALQQVPSFRADDFSDWRVTALYYSACLLVKAYLKTRNVTVQDHVALRSRLFEEDVLDPIAKQYRLLEERSRDARYEGRRFTNFEIRERILPAYEAVTARLGALLRAAGLMVGKLDARSHFHG